MFSALSVETRKFIVLVFFSLPIDVFSFLYTVQVSEKGSCLSSLSYVFMKLLRMSQREPVRSLVTNHEIVVIDQYELEGI